MAATFRQAQRTAEKKTETGKHGEEKSRFHYTPNIIHQIHLSNQAGMM